MLNGLILRKKYGLEPRRLSVLRGVRKFGFHCILRFHFVRLQTVPIFNLQKSQCDPERHETDGDINKPPEKRGRNQ